MNPRTILNLVLAAVVVVTTFSHAAWAADDTDRKMPPAAITLKAANEQATARLQKVERHWQTQLRTLGSVQRLQKMARELASLEEKLSRGASWIRSQSTTKDRIRQMFHRYVLNETELMSVLRTEFAAFEQQLMNETAKLYVRAGLTREIAEKAIGRYRVSDKGWNEAFQPLLKKADSLATRDFFRLVAISAGSSVIGDALMEAGHDAGMIRAEKGSWSYLIGNLVTQAVVETVIEEVTDPTEDFAKQLAPLFTRGQQELLSGPNGFLRQVSALTNLHIKARNLHLNTLKKGGE